VPCQNALMPNRPRLLRITSISAEPIRAPKAVPIPPARLARASSHSYILLT